MPRLLKRILLFLLPGALIAGFFFGRHIYFHFQNKKAHEEFMANLSNTASPTVYKDSIWIDYQEEYRTLHIYVPPDYDQDTTKRYPVMYFMDGESSFNDMENEAPEWQIDEVIDSASAKGQPTAIVIGIEEAQDRDAEYTPFVNEDNPNAHGDQYAEWVATDLKSWVDSAFRTQTEPKATTIGGISMIPRARAVFEKFKAAGLGDDQVRFEKIPGEGHWHPTWRKSFAMAYPWVMDMEDKG